MCVNVAHGTKPILFDVDWILMTSSGAYYYDFTLGYYDNSESFNYVVGLISRILLMIYSSQTVLEHHIYIPSPIHIMNILIRIKHQFKHTAL